MIRQGFLKKNVFLINDFKRIKNRRELIFCSDKFECEKYTPYPDFCLHFANNSRFHDKNIRNMLALIFSFAGITCNHRGIAHHPCQCLQTWCVKHLTPSGSAICLEFHLLPAPIIEICQHYRQMLLSRQKKTLMPPPGFAFTQENLHPILFCGKDLKPVSFDHLVPHLG